MKRIHDILTRHKTPVSVEDDVTYKQVTIRTNYNGVVLRGTQSGATIGTKNQWRVSAGQFILSRIDARNGAFGIIPEELEGAIVTNDFLAFDINEDEVEREFFNVFLQSPVFLEACIRASRGNTNRKRVDEAFFLNYEVNLPPLEEQHDLIKRINKGRASVGIAQHEIAHQQALLGKLKQAILQEAIQGKLTADWRASNPDVEPASKLLKRIQAEKARLIADKKLRKEKPLPPITPEEIPFEIPEGWEWCRFADVQTGSDAGSSPKCEERPVVGDEWGILKVSATSGTRFRQDENKFFKTKIPKEHAAILHEGDFILSRANTKELAGNSVLVEGLTRNLILSDKTIRFRLSQEVSSRYVNMVNKAAFVREHFICHATGASPSMKNLSRDSITSHTFPLPPLAEQVAIVERVEALMAHCRELETEIEHSRTHAAHLLQAVLKEAFAPSD
jgi:type I restriction enzyme S subunit